VEGAETFIEKKKAPAADDGRYTPEGVSYRK
jgi:hypothetical protein